MEFFLVYKNIENFLNKVFRWKCYEWIRIDLDLFVFFCIEIMIK